MRTRCNPNMVIAVDGGITEENAQEVVSAGADALIAGTAFSRQQTRKQQPLKSRARHDRIQQGKMWLDFQECCHERPRSSLLTWRPSPMSTASNPASLTRVMSAAVFSPLSDTATTPGGKKDEGLPK